MRWFPENLIKKRDMATDEVRVRMFLALVIGIVAPMLGVFALFHALAGRYIEGGINLIVIILLSSVFLPLLRGAEFRPAFRLALAFTLVAIIAVVERQMVDNLGWLWLYLFPPITALIFGYREGLVWTLIAPLGVLPVLFSWTGEYGYPIEVSLRFLLTYVLLGTLSLVLESTRYFYVDRLRREQRELTALLHHKRALSGLLPICAACKSVRDDSGYWSQIETFLADHSAASLSQGICPECAAKSADDHPRNEIYG